MRLAIVYDTKTGNTAKMAEYLIEGFTAVDGAEAKAFPITAVDEEYVKASDALIVGTPTYNGYLTARMKAWLESTPAKLNVAGKLGGAYATAAFIHGGGDLAIQCILTHLLVDGMMVYSSGQAKGMPVIHLGPVAIAPDLDAFADLFRIYGKRMAEQVACIV
ncbi:NAD(P)H-dependent oxidoreductase [Flavonifractor sp. An92]|uniref:flavodoxin family protein n=1 Tax=Flavonifractor sp. An92 TaxID=1965666 RepID=UPI0013023E03|nr:NAD(P)H-dependent oxidoreductase [Flavonifractor sp. An92]